MKLLHYAVDSPRLVLVVALVVFVGAIFAALEIPVQRTPAIHTAVVVVAVPYPGAKPDEVEDQITRKLEERLQRLDRVDWMQSSAERGAGVVTIVFEDGVEAHRARNDVEHLVNEVRNELPLGREVQPQIVAIDFDNLPILRVTVTGPEGFDPRALKTIAEEVQDELEIVGGVANTVLFGGQTREIHVDYDPELLNQYCLTIADLKNALAQSHLSMPGGSLSGDVFNLQVRSATKFTSVRDVEEAPIRQVGGRLVCIKDVAEVLDSAARTKSKAELDGLPGCTIFVNKEPNINVLATCQQVKSRVLEMQAKYPHLTFTVSGDTSREIWVMFAVLGSSAIYGGLLVFLILYLSMGFRGSFLVVLAIPFSTAVALLVIYCCGYAISNMVIFSYILALGMVVDGAIIVTENIYRHLEMGVPAELAAKRGIEEVAVPVFSADLTTVAAFAPMLLVPGIMGDFMGLLPITVGVALTGSMFVDHFIIPSLVAVWFKYQPLKYTQRPGDDLPINQMCGGTIRWIVRTYEKTLRFCLANRMMVMAMVLCGMAWSFLMLASGAIGATFFPPSDRGQFTINYELPLGYSVEESARASACLTKPLEELRKSGELKHYVTAVGSSSAAANPLEGDASLGPEFGRISVELVPPGRRKRSQDEIVAALRKAIQPYPGMKYNVKLVQEGPPGGAAVAMRLTGDRLDQLGAVAEMLVADLKKMPGVIDVRSDFRPDSPEIVVDPDPSVVGLWGMSKADLSRAIATSVLGDDSLELVLDDEEVPIRLQAQADFQRFPEHVRNMMIQTPAGRIATVGEVASVRREEGPYSIIRRDRRRAVVVSCDCIGKRIDPKNGTLPVEVFARMRKLLAEKYQCRPGGGSTTLVGAQLQKAGLSTGALAMSFLGQPGGPAEGVRVEFTGENEEQQENYFHLTKVMILAIVLIAGILVVQFNSFRQTAAVLLAIPLSFIGVVLGMWLCRFDFSLAAFIGLVSLTGVVVNDAIVMVDFTNVLRAQGKGLYESLIEAGVTRLRPVMLTTLTTIGGLLPLLLNLSGGAEFWQPLSGAIIFGLAMSTLLTLVVIPVFYSISYDPLGRGQAAIATIPSTLDFPPQPHVEPAAAAPAAEASTAPPSAPAPGEPPPAGGSGN